MKKRFFSIKTQLTNAFIIISFLIVCSVNYFSFISNVKEQKNSFVQNSIIQANLLADFSVSALVFLDSDGMKDNLEKLKSNKDILQVIIYDENNKTFSQYNPLNLPQPFEIKYTDLLNDVNLESFFKSPTVKIFVPIQHKNQKYGTLYLEKSTNFIKELVTKLLKDIFVFTIILLVIIYIISLFLSRYFLNPILSLAQISQKIATSRDYKTRVEYKSKNEIGTLYNSFNTLLEDIENLTNDLENKVNSRTLELQNSLNDLKEAQNRLIESEKMSALGNLVSGVAHEVNTPLGNALTSSTIISREVNDVLNDLRTNNLKRSVFENKLEIINQSSILLEKTLKYASNLIKSFKQISVDQVTDDIREIDLKRYLEDVFLTNANKLKIQAVQKEIICEEQIILKTSPGVIAQIFNNLIQNSLLHGFENFQDRAKIIVKIEKEKSALIISYEDNGVGIEDSIKGKIFEPFITTKRNAGGTGLGLNIVYNLVHQKLDGSLKVVSQRNIGTKFIITIPQNTNKE